MTDLIKIFDERGELTEAVSVHLRHWEEEIKRAEENRKHYLEAIQQAMEANGVKKFENDIITITYVDPTTRVSLDQKALKENDFDLYLKYAKESPVKASVRIKCK